jgi:sterol desaturase/sphingolipid hydroxylase (fatty acid hydroxylase superfamily)
MNEADFGKRDKLGYWRPFKRTEYPPLFTTPVRPAATAKWIFGYPGYLLPWNALYAVVALGVWYFLTPPIETMRSFSIGWITFLLVRNTLIVLAFYGVWHARLYMQKSQGANFKFNAKWPSSDNDAFLFKRQNVDNLIWTFASAVPIWTAYEVVFYWAFANHRIPFVTWSQYPIYCVALMLAIPFFRDVHFFFVHRALHWPPMYRFVHSLHHNNVNPGPWSGLAMHPVEHVLYFSGVLIHVILPSSPVHVLFHLLHLGLVPAQVHSGFERVVLADGTAVDADAYSHYLHHRYLECNYSDGAIPLDLWFGTFNDGSKEAEVSMNQRFLARNRKLRDKVAGGAHTSPPAR